MLGKPTFGALLPPTELECRVTMNEKKGKIQQSCFGRVIHPAVIISIDLTEYFLKTANTSEHRLIVLLIHVSSNHYDYCNRFYSCNPLYCGITTVLLDPEHRYKSVRGHVCSGLLYLLQQYLLTAFV